MKQQSNKEQRPDQQENQEPNPPSGGFGYSWFYLMLFLFLLVISFFFNPVSGTKEITWSFFQDSLLTKHKVEKIVVVNKETAEIYIKKENLNDPKNKGAAEKKFHPVEAPQYGINIGSVEIFEQKLQQAQQEFPPAEKLDVLAPVGSVFYLGSCLFASSSCFGWLSSVEWAVVGQEVIRCSISENPHLKFQKRV